MKTATRTIVSAPDLSPGLARFSPDAGRVVDHCFWEEVTLAGIAEELGVSPVLARQLEKKAAGQIKKAFHSRTKLALSA